MQKNIQSPPEKNSEAKILDFQGLKGKKVSMVFDEPELTSDAGLLAIAQLENPLGYIEKVAGCINDRRAGPIHSIKALLKQRIYQIIGGYPDANDCDRMRDDGAMQTVVGVERQLASQPTLSRLENAVNMKDLVRMAYAIAENFLDSFEEAPRMIVIDMDPTAHLVYGQQQLGLFNTHVGDTCLMPFHVYDGLTGRLITTVMRSGKTPNAAEILAVLKRMVRKIRERFGQTLLLFRADSHHTKPQVMEWMEENGVGWITGLAPNKALNRKFALTIQEARSAYKRNAKEGYGEEPVRRFASGWHKAGSWSAAQRVICRVIAGPNGFDARYVVTSYEQASAKYLYETVYCGRGKAELYIKEHKLGLESDRSACQSAMANQFRLFLHSVAYQLMHAFREKILQGSELANASFAQIRIKLLKVAGRVRRLKTRIRFHLPLTFGYKHLFAAACQAGRQVALRLSG